MARLLLIQDDMSRLRLAVLCLFVCVAAIIHAAQPPQTVDVEIGHALKLEAYDGPNVQIVVTSTDSSNVTVTTYDFERMVVSVSGGNGGSRPTVTNQQIPITGEATLLFRRNGMTVFYVGSGDRISHVVFTIVTEQAAKRNSKGF